MSPYVAVLGGNLCLKYTTFPGDSTSCKERVSYSTYERTSPDPGAFFDVWLSLTQCKVKFTQACNEFRQFSERSCP